MNGRQREAARQHIEIPENKYNYARWHAQLEEIFTQLSIVRSLIEDEYTNEERARIVRTNALAWESFLKLVPSEDQVSLRDTFFLLGTHDSQAATTLRNRLGELARHAAEMIRTTAPSVVERQTMDNEREKDDRNPTHEWLKGNEAERIAEKLTECVNQVTKHDQLVHTSLYYGIGAIQSLYTIIEKLREKIDDGSIDVGGRDAQDCLNLVTAARHMIVRALTPSTDTDYPNINLATIDIDILNEAADIAGYLSVVKMTSV